MTLPHGTLAPRGPPAPIAPRPVTPTPPSPTRSVSTTSTSTTNEHHFDHHPHHHQHQHQLYHHQQEEGTTLPYSQHQDDDTTFNAMHQASIQVRRRRANHNEIERQRRTVQKERIDDLRRAIPSMSSERHASTVQIVTRAKEYIDYMKGRVAELESYVRVMLDQKSTGVAAAVGSSVNGGSGSGSGGTILSGGDSGVINGTLIHQSLLQQSALTAPSTPPLANRKRSRSPLAPEELMLPTATSTGTNSNTGIDRPHRKSSLIFPTGDSQVLFGRRDSLQQLFAGIIPSILEDSSQFDIKCNKCAAGINNLVMIDCDRCQNWYHIRCVGISTSAIPSSWHCAECVRRR